MITNNIDFPKLGIHTSINTTRAYFFFICAIEIYSFSNVNSVFVDVSVEEDPPFSTLILYFFGSIFWGTVIIIFLSLQLLMLSTVIFLAES